jgi:hypothetical protein
MNTLEYQSINLLVPSLLYQSIALPDSFCMQWSITGVRDSSSNSLYWANCFLFFFFCNKSNLINNRSYPKPGPMGEGPHDLIHNRELTRLQQELDYCKKKRSLNNPSSSLRYLPVAVRVLFSEAGRAARDSRERLAIWKVQS